MATTVEPGRVQKSVGLSPAQRDAYQRAHVLHGVSAAQVDEAVIRAAVEERHLSWPAWERRPGATRSGREFMGRRRKLPRRGQKIPHVTTWTGEQWLTIETALEPSESYAQFFLNAHEQYMPVLFRVPWPA